MKRSRQIIAFTGTQRIEWSETSKPDEWLLFLALVFRKMRFCKVLFTMIVFFFFYILKSVTFLYNRKCSDSFYLSKTLYIIVLLK